MNSAKLSLNYGRDGAIRYPSESNSGVISSPYRAVCGGLWPPADQRFYASTYGRFNTADPYAASGGPEDPGSWNRYAYVGGDPVNWLDPQGTFKQKPDLSLPLWTLFGYWSSGDQSGAPLGPPPQSKSEFFSETYKQNGFAAAASLSAQCKKALGDKGVSVTSLEALAVQVDYFNATDDEIGNRSINSFFDNGDFHNLNASGYGNAFVPVDRAGENRLSKVVIRAGFFLKSIADRQTILVHELLHIYTNKDDQSLRNFLGLDQSDSEPSPQITEWLAKDCPKK